jgi:LmbE family N-acetylglucosaminyl deacetylase
MIVFLSPHLDDAILSCGGWIHKLRQQGEAVQVINVMAGKPPHPLPQTPLIADLHHRWQAGDDPVQTRIEEDRAAFQRLGVEYVTYLDWPDCPYRTDNQGNPLYSTNNDLFGEIHPDDPARHIVLPIPSQATRVIAPLGAGAHVDHKLVRMLASQLGFPVEYYEEYPYSASSGEARRITGSADVQPVGTEAVQQALQVFKHPMRPHIIKLSEADLSVKIEAVACYRSQISTFWDSQGDMAARIRAYALEVQAPAAERTWISEKEILN